MKDNQNNNLYELYKARPASSSLTTNELLKEIKQGLSQKGESRLIKEALALIYDNIDTLRNGGFLNLPSAFNGEDFVTKLEDLFSTYEIDLHAVLKHEENRMYIQIYQKPEWR